ncbi:MAG: hypothetical protein ACO1QB_04115 [Verrucomicrobiales bacterium]
MTLPECRPALEAIYRSTVIDKRALAMFVAERWAKLNPEDALKSSNVPGEFAQIIRRVAASTLVKLKGENVLLLLDAANLKDNKNLATWILPALMEINPEAVAGFLTAHPDISKDSFLIKEIASALIEHSPSAAFEMVRTFIKPGKEEYFISELWGEWLQIDPLSAAAMIDSAGFHDEEKFRLLNRISGSWSKKDPVAALAWVKTLTDERSKSEALGAFDVTFMTSDSLFAELMIVAEKPEQKTHLVRTRASHLATEDIQSALNWAASLSEEDMRDPARSQIYERWVETDPEKFAQHLVLSKEAEKQTYLFEQSIKGWASEDLDAASSWVENMAAGNERDQALAALLPAIRNKDSLKAVALLNQIDDKKSRNKAILSVVGTYAINDGPSAVALANQLPHQDQPEAYERLMKTWGVKDKNAAGNWVKTLASGKGRDAALKEYVKVIAREDPATAIQWANAIEDPYERPNALMETFQRLADHDAAAAEKWLADAAVEPAFKPFFERELQQRRDLEDESHPPD